MKNQPYKKQHYIPRFILKNFCFEGDKTNYYSTVDKKLSQAFISNIFKDDFLYRSEELFSKDPNQVEKDLALYEAEMRDVIVNKILNYKDNIVLSVKEIDSLKLFCAIFSLRSVIVRDAFINRYPKENSEGKNKWLYNLSKVVKCRSVQEVLNDNEIDEYIKKSIARDTENTSGTYFSFAETRGKLDFILSDSYPTYIWESYGKYAFGIVYIFPLSPNFVMFLFNKAFKNDEFFSKFQKLPRQKGNNEFLFNIKKIYEQDVKFINNFSVEFSKKGFAFKDIKRIKLDNIDLSTDNDSSGQP